MHGLLLQLHCPCHLYSVTRQDRPCGDAFGQCVFIGYSGQDRGQSEASRHSVESRYEREVET